MIAEEIVRRERLEALNRAGLEAYPAQTNRTHQIGQILAAFEVLEAAATPVSLVGRVRSIRKHGGVTFITLEDETGALQMVLHRDSVGTETYENFHQQSDVGDFFEFHGPVFKTQKGERSLKIETSRLLTKALLPLPEKWHGLTDTETRYRQRYLDLIANESVRQTARTRARLVAALRRFLEVEGFMEVETPMLQPIAGGASARPFVTHHNALGTDFYLRVAPELYLKRLIVGGFEKIYEYARCFRNEGISPQHNPEFTQIEAYWAYATIEDLMAHLERMISSVIQEALGDLMVTVDDERLSFAAPYPRMSFRDLVMTHAGIDLESVTDEADLRQAMNRLKIKTDGVIGLGELIDHLYKSKVRPQIIQPTFVTDYPAVMKPLAKRRGDSIWSASAQLVVNGMEVCNAFNELNNPLEQQARFEEQEDLRAQGSEEAQRIDHDYITALKHGMPPTAGYGIGIDRFVALLTDSPNLKEVILFPTLKPEAKIEPDDL
jgi:lysyl-tRNA synthetase class 2